MKRPEITDFGGWVQSLIDKSDKFTVSDLSRETGIPYPSLDRILKSGRRGKIVRPGEERIDAISQALLKAGLIEDMDEAWVAAGFIVEGYEIKKTGDEYHQNSPVNQNNGDDLETLVSRAGYSADILDDEGRERLRQSVDAAVIGVMEQEKRKKRT